MPPNWPIFFFFIMHMFQSIFHKKDSDALDINWIGLQQMCTPYDLNVKVINTI